MVSRYTFDGVEEYNPQGDWVSVSDYDALAAENQALRERAEAAQKNYLDTRMEVTLLEEAHSTVSGALATALAQLIEARASAESETETINSALAEAIFDRDAALRAEPAAWNDAIEAAATWHQSEIARLKEQVSENNAYLARVGAASYETDANRCCNDQIFAHQQSIAAIRALRRAAPTEGEA